MALTPEAFLAAVRAIVPEQAQQRVSRLQPLLNQGDNVLFPGGDRDDRGSTTRPGQLQAGTTEAFVESFPGFRQAVTTAFRAHTDLTAAEQAVLLAVHDPLPAVLPASPLTATEDAHLLCFLQRATIGLNKGVLSMAIAGYPSESAAVLVTQGRRLLAHIIAEGTKYCAAQNLPAKKWRETALQGKEILSRTPAAFSDIYAWASMATQAAAAFLEANGQLDALRTDVWMVTQGLHAHMGVTVAEFSTTSPQDMS
jgi:hypothetical protein